MESITSQGQAGHRRVSHLSAGRHLFIICAAVALAVAYGPATQGQTFIVDNLNLDTVVANDTFASSQTEGVKNGPGENNGSNQGTISSGDPGTQGYWQGFQTGSSGNISQLTLDLAVLYSPTPGTDKNVSGADTATFYLYSYPDAMIIDGGQIGPAIATLTAADVEGGTPVGYSSNNSSDIYQYNFLSSLTLSYDLAANTAYAIVMMTSSGNQDVGWAESNTINPLAIWANSRKTC